MEDFDLLLKEAHELGIKVIMDLVINHSSDQHQWFEESKNLKKARIAIITFGSTG